MPQIVFDKIIKIVQIVLTILQFALKAFGFDSEETDSE